VQKAAGGSRTKKPDKVLCGGLKKSAGKS